MPGSVQDSNILFFTFLNGFIQFDPFKYKKIQNTAFEICSVIKKL